MEYCDDGDLFMKILHHKKTQKKIPEQQIWNILLQAIKGLQELHSRKIFHRDLKSANIFISKTGQIKVGDMNVSKLAQKGLLYTQTGTPYYASPEVWQDKPYCEKSDIWSLGCIIYELITLHPPFRAENMEGLYKKVVKGSYERISRKYSKELRNIVRLMLQVKAKNRVSCHKILSYPFICKKLEGRFRVDVEKGFEGKMLETIKIPKDLMYLSSHLPKANYSPLKLRKDIGVCEKSYGKSVYLSLNLVGKRGKENGRYRFKSKKVRKRFNLPNLNNKKIVMKREKENRVSENLNMKLKKTLGSQKDRKKINLVTIKSINRIPLTKKYYNPYIKNKKLKKNIKLKPIKL